MGALISRWRKKPKSTLELLEQTEKELSQLQGVHQGNVEQKRRIIFYLLFYSALTYIGAAIIFYLYYMPESNADRLLYSSPLLLFPLLIYFIKRFLHWYFVKRITKTESALEELNKKKMELLDVVKEKETYKVAKEILAKFDTDRQQASEPAPFKTPAPSRAPDGQELHHRKPFVTPRLGSSAPSSPALAHTRTPLVTPHPPPAAPATHSGRPLPGTPAVFSPGLPMPRPILPRERGTVERLMEMLVGDGPQNRYALICAQCHSHNGMALREEFEYISFRCCYCYHLNPSRKEKPRAPRLNWTPRASVDNTPRSQAATTDKLPESSGSQESAKQEDQASSDSNPGPKQDSDSSTAD